MTWRAAVIAFVVTVVVLAVVVKIAGARRERPATPTELRHQLVRERTVHRRTVKRLRQLNRRLVAAYISGPGYVSPRAAAWACIHSREGAWDDDGAPYWGGLQMDESFENTYGPEFKERWGHASEWPIWAQIVAADRAYAVRGFTPWPNTARACGLL